MAFSPSDIAGLKLWFRADTGITKDAQGLVSKWADQSGNGFDTETQATDGFKPYLISNYINGRPAVGFYGNDFLRNTTSPVITGATARTVVFCANSFDSTQGDIAFGPGWGGNGACWGITDTTLYGRGGGAFDITGLTTFGNSGSNTVQVMAVTWDGVYPGTGLNRYTNNVAVTANGTAGNWNTANGYVIGNWAVLDRYFVGAISEILVYDSVLSSQDLTNVYNWVIRSATAPVNLSVDSVTSSSATLSWSDSMDIDRYQIWYSETDSFATATAGAIVDQGTETATIGCLSAETPYYFWIVAVDNSGNVSSESSSVSDTTSAAPAPDAPTSLAAGTPGLATIPLTWTDPASADRVLIYYSETNDSSTAEPGAWADFGDQAATVGGLSSGTLYYFWAKSVSSAGILSAFSTGTSGTTQTTNATLPTSLAIASMGRTTATLTWADGAGNSYVEVFYNTSDNSGTATYAGLANQGDLKYTVSGLSEGTQYYFWIRGRHADTSVSNFVGSVTDSTYGSSGSTGTDIVTQIVTAMKTRLAAVLSSDFKQLPYPRDIEKNDKFAANRGYGVIPGSSDPSEAQVLGSYTQTQTFSVVLTRKIISGKKTDRDLETAEQELYTWFDRIRRDFQGTKLHETDVLVIIGIASSDPPEYYEDNETVAIRYNFPVTYRNSLT